MIIPNSRRWLDLIAGGCLSILLIASTLSYINKSKSGFTFFLGGAGFLFLFNYFLYIGSGARHYGYFFLILIGSLWISQQEKNKLKSNELNHETPISQNLSKFFPRIFVICLSIHLATGAHYMINDFNKPFSAGKATAEYIVQQGWQDDYLFGSKDNILSTVSGYLNKDIYYPEIKDFGSYAQWNNRKLIKREEVLNEVKIFFDKYQNASRLLLVLSRDSALTSLAPGEMIIYKNIQIIADKSFEESWHDSERFFLYWATKLI